MNASYFSAWYSVCNIFLTAVSEGIFEYPYIVADFYGSIQNCYQTQRSKNITDIPLGPALLSVILCILQMSVGGERKRSLLGDRNSSTFIKPSSDDRLDDLYMCPLCSDILINRRYNETSQISPGKRNTI